MGLRDSFFRLLSKGGPPEDPDEPVEIGIIPLAVGPMTVETLRNAGFNAVGAPTYNIISEVANRYRILVPRSEAVDATRLLDELRS
jgi:hypothetical protein